MTEMNQKPIKFLIVDDDSIILDMLKLILSALDIFPDAAQNGTLAIEKIRQNDYDVIITDDRMPGSSGIEVTQEAKQKNRNTQVIVFTGFANLDMAISALRFGATDFIQKPARRDVLLSVINKCIEKKKLIDENIKLSEDLLVKNTDLQKALETIEEQHKIILHNERLKALGSMAAGIAHEINNPLVFISANIQTLEKYVEKMDIDDGGEIKNLAILNLFSKEIQGILKGIRNGIVRVTRIVSGLKTFARKDSENPEMVYLSNAIEESLELCSPFLENIRVTTHKTGEEKPIRIVNQHLIQVIVNLVQNACDAMRNVPNPAINILLQSFQDKQILSIQDNGTGIKKEIIQKIFEPFFTTKEVGQGTGIGLAITYGIVKNSGGEIEVLSDGQNGTTFNLIWKHNVIMNN